MSENLGRKDLDEFLLDLHLTQETALECLIQARKRQALYYNDKRKPFPIYTEGENVLLLRKFIHSRQINSQLDYCYIGTFRVKRMIGKNAVELDIRKECPKLHPVFNVSLIFRYVDPNVFKGRDLVEGIKEKYYTDEEIVDWKLMKVILDAKEYKKGKYEFLVSWNGATVANDTWILEEHFPESMRSYLLYFRQLHGDFFAEKKKKRGKAKVKKVVNQPGVLGVQG
jgi:hypothetical protein